MSEVYFSASWFQSDYMYEGTDQIWRKYFMMYVYISHTNPSLSHRTSQYQGEETLAASGQVGEIEALARSSDVPCGGCWSPGGQARRYRMGIFKLETALCKQQEEGLWPIAVQTWK